MMKPKLYKELASLAKEFEIIGPKKIANKGIFFEQITNIEDLYLGNEFTIDPVKKFFLEPSECIITNKYEDRKTSIEVPALPAKKRIILGLRPCEARGLELLDKVFAKDGLKDRSYINNRERSILVGVACSKPDNACFCTSLGGSPADTRGLDAMILLDETGEGLEMEIISDRAGRIFASLEKEGASAPKESRQSEKEKMKGLVTKKAAIRDSLGDSFASGYWDEVSRACISCGVCTYLCPTCHCFDLVDEERKRLRCYDGCSFRAFTQETSGENPRPTKKERYRQRVFHKFDYFRKNFGEHLCVGCGRCIRACPVKIDISKIASGATGNNE